MIDNRDPFIRKLVTLVDQAVDFVVRHGDLAFKDAFVMGIAKTPASIIPSPSVIPAKAGIQARYARTSTSAPVIPAKAGIQKHWTGLHSDPLDSRLRGNDDVGR